MKVLLLLALLVLGVAADPLVDFTASHSLSYRLGQTDLEKVRAAVKPHLADRPGADLILRLRQLQGLRREIEIVGQLNEALTAQARAEAATAGLGELADLPPGLPTGDLTIVPHLPFSTYLELSASLYRDVAPDPGPLDRVFATYAGYRRRGTGIAESVELARKLLAPLRAQVARSLKLSPDSPRLPEAETQMWGSYLELRWQHQEYLAHWEGQARSLYVLLMTHLAELDLLLLPHPGRPDPGRPDPATAPARQAGEAAGREVAAAGLDADESLATVELHWERWGRRDYPAFLQGYLDGLRSRPGARFRSQEPGFSLQVPFGWLLLTTPADLHVTDPEGLLQLSIWSYQDDERLGPEAIGGLVNARLRDDPNLARVTGPSRYAAGGFSWEASQPALSSRWRVVCVPAGPPPTRVYLVLIGSGPPARGEELDAVVNRVTRSVTP